MFKYCELGQNGTDFKLTDEFEKKFRSQAEEKFGSGEEGLTKALEEALNNWAANAVLRKKK